MWVKDPVSPVFLNFFPLSWGMNIHDWKYARVFFFSCVMFFCLGALPNVIPSCARLFSVSVGLRPDRRIGAG